MEDHLTKQMEELIQLVHKYHCIPNSILRASFHHPMEGGLLMG